MPEAVVAGELPKLADLRVRAVQAHFEKWHTIRLELETVTPVYGGGTLAGMVDQLLPFRPRAIKNGIRHWWWLLNRGSSRYAKPGGNELLYQDIVGIWGGAGDNDEGHTARVRVRVSALPSLETIGRHIRDYVPKGSRYALWMAMGGADRDPAKLLAPGVPFALQIDVASDLDDISQTGIGYAVNAWIHLGGIGARTTRGLGRLSIRSVRFPAGKEALTVRATVNVKQDAWFTENFRDSDNLYPGEFKYCVPSTTRAVQASPLDAWILALRLYQEYRQARQRDPDGRRMKQSYWPKADVIRVVEGPAGHKPHPAIIAAPPNPNLPVSELMFGGPIVYRFKRGPNPEPQEGTLLFASGDATELDRYTSPLMVTCLRISDEEYVPFAAYYANHWRDISDKQVVIKTKTVGRSKKIRPGVWWPNIDDPVGQAAANAILSGSVMHPAKGPDQRRQALIDAAPSDGDPLHAFLNFFQSWRCRD